MTNFFQNACGITPEEKQLSVSGRNWGEVDLNGQLLFSIHIFSECYILNHLVLCYPWSGSWECSSVGVNSLSLSLCVFILGKWINSDGTTLAYTNFLLFFFFFFFSWEFYCFSRKLQCHLHAILWTIHEVTIIWCFSFVNFPFPFFFFVCVAFPHS